MASDSSFFLRKFKSRTSFQRVACERGGAEAGRVVASPSKKEKTHGGRTPVSASPGSVVSFRPRQLGGCIEFFVVSVKATLETEKAECCSASEDTDREASAPKKRPREDGGDVHKNAKKNMRGASKAQTASASTDSEMKVDEEFKELARLAAKSRKFLGAHISAAGGAENAPVNCLKIKGTKRSASNDCWETRFFAPPSERLLFSAGLSRGCGRRAGARVFLEKSTTLVLSAHRKRGSAPLILLSWILSQLLGHTCMCASLCAATQTDASVKGFKRRMQELEMDLEMQVLPHGSYLINVANPGKRRALLFWRLFLSREKRRSEGGISACVQTRANKKRPTRRC